MRTSERSLVDARLQAFISGDLYSVLALRRTHLGYSLNRGIL
jgi:hypothetical protein